MIPEIAFYDLGSLNLYFGKPLNRFYLYKFFPVISESHNCYYLSQSPKHPEYVYFTKACDPKSQSSVMSVMDISAPTE